METITYKGHNALVDVRPTFDISRPPVEKDTLVILRSPLLQCISKPCTQVQAEAIKKRYVRWFEKAVNDKLKAAGSK